MKDRIFYIKKIIKGKTVLNLGCTSSNPLKEIKKQLWLHKELEQYAKNLIGTDINKELLKKIQKLTKTKVIYADATNMNLNKKFDVIVGGELIEHIANLDGFIKSIKKHMKKDTKIILTTPNVFKFKNLIKAVRGKKAFKHPDHVVYFDEGTIKELLSRYDLKVLRIEYSTEKTVENNMGNKIMRFIGTILKRYNETMIIIIGNK